MLRTKVSCPRCHTSWSADRETLLGKKIKCLKCGERFVANGNGSLSAFVPVAAPFAPPPGAPATWTGVPALTATGLAPVAAPYAPPPSSGRGLVLGLSLGALALFLVGGAALAAYCFTASDDGPGTGGNDAVVVSPPSLPRVPVPPTKELPAQPLPPPATPPVSPPAAPPSARPPAPPDAPPPRIEKRPPQVVRAAPPSRQALINKAIDQGVLFLKQRQHPDGTWDNVGGHMVGPVALCGLTLLECGVPRDDRAVTAAARYVRMQAPFQQWTYDTSLAVLFLDRLGDPSDERLIQTLAARLIGGQNEFGGWTYTCRMLSQPEDAQLLTFLRQNRPKLPRGIRPGGPPDLTAIGKNGGPLPTGIRKGKAGDLPQGIAPGKDDPLLKGIQKRGPGDPLPKGISSGKKGDPAGGPNPALITPFQPGEGPNKAARTKPGSADKGARPGNPDKVAKRPATKRQPKLWPNQLLPSVRNLPVISGRSTAEILRGPRGRMRVMVPGEDNSNSQFAMLALWVARRYDVPVERTMALVHKRYHLSQHPDGGWSYHTEWGRTRPRAGGWVFESRPSMTCVGLLGLAMGHGSAQEARAGAKAGAAAPGKKAKEPAPLLADPAIQGGLKKLGTWVGSPTGNKDLPLAMDLYALWSVERVAVLYNLKTIGGKDWYGWEVEMLLPTQRPDGSWFGPAHPGGNNVNIDTCFALLILKRANLVQDLSDNLRLYIAITDPDGSGSPGSHK